MVAYYPIFTPLLLAPVKHDAPQGTDGTNRPPFPYSIHPDGRGALSPTFTATAPHRGRWRTSWSTTGPSHPCRSMRCGRSRPRTGSRPSPTRGSSWLVAAHDVNVPRVPHAPAWPPWPGHVELGYACPWETMHIAYRSARPTRASTAQPSILFSSYEPDRRACGQVGDFDTVCKTCQTPYCSLGRWDGTSFAQVGDGLCASASHSAMRIVTSALGVCLALSCTDSFMLPSPCLTAPEYDLRELLSLCRRHRLPRGYLHRGALRESGVVR